MRKNAARGEEHQDGPLRAGAQASQRCCSSASGTHAQRSNGRPLHLYGYDPAGSGEGEICAMNTDGSSQVNLTNDRAADDEVPRLGRRTGRRSRTRTSARTAMRRSSRWTATARTSTISRTTRRTTTTTRSGRPTAHSWSGHAAVVGDQNFDIWVMHADGTNQTQLTTAPELDGAPVWSPDGTKIAFYAPDRRLDGHLRDERRRERRVVNLTHTTPRRGLGTPSGGRRYEDRVRAATTSRQRTQTSESMNDGRLEHSST